MKVKASKSFFDSIKDIDSWKSKYRNFKTWIKYHTTKEFKNLLKVVLKSYPWDYGYLYEIEQAKIAEMVEYHRKYQRFVGWEQAVRDMEICYKLIDIILDKKNLFHYDGQIQFLPIENSEDVELDGSKLVYHCDVKVNTKNADRFVDTKTNKWYVEHPHELYKEKAKYLYHKIRLERDFDWWD